MAGACPRSRTDPSGDPPRGINLRNPPTGPADRTRRSRGNGARNGTDFQQQRERDRLVRQTYPADGGAEGGREPACEPAIEGARDCGLLQYPDGISRFSPSIAFLNFGLSSFPARSLSAYIWRTTAAENGGEEEGEVGPVGERKTDKSLGWLCQSPHPPRC